MNDDEPGPFDAFEVEGDAYPFSSVPDWLVLAPPPITDRDVRVYCVLRLHVNRARQDDEAWPSQAAIARVLGLSKPDQVGESIKRLRAIGAIVSRQVTGKKGKYTKYRVLLEPAPGHAVTWPRCSADLYRSGVADQMHAERVAPKQRPERRRPADESAAQGGSPQNEGYPQTGDPSPGGNPSPGGGGSPQGWGTNHLQEQPPQKRTPQPPAAAGGGCVHGKASCRACGTSPRQRAAAAVVSEQQRAAACTWCRQDFASASAPFLVLDPDRPHEYVTPALRCDHVTPPELALAERELGAARDDLVHHGGEDGPVQERYAAALAARNEARRAGGVRDHGDVRAS